MSIHIGRNNFPSGVGQPLIMPAFVGQNYIDTSTNPRNVWIATSKDVSGWKPMAHLDHIHGLDDIYGLRQEVAKLVQEEGISSSIAALKDGTNIWTGTNVFDGELRGNGGKVLSVKSSIGELSDVDLTVGLNNLSVLGFNGSKFIPMKLDGVKPETTTIDFGAYVRKDSIVNNLNSNSANDPLSAAQGAELKRIMEADYAKKDHVHTGYATANHTHAQYLDKNADTQEMKGILNIVSQKSNDILNMSGKRARMNIRLSSGEDEPTLVIFDGIQQDLNNVIFGSTDGAIGRRVTFNFSEVVLPGGKLLLGENSKYFQIPTLRMQTSDLNYVGNTKKEFGLDMSNSAIIGASQVVFGRPSKGRLNSIMFPKSYAGNSKPTEAALYHYMYMVNDEMVTDTALASEKGYISLNGVRYFFGSFEPGREARNGDVWFKV